MSLILVTRRALLLAATGFALAAPAAQAQAWRQAAVVGAPVTSLSGDGQAAAGSTTDTFEAFRWTTAGGLVALGRGTWLPLGHRSGTPQISADGSTVAATILDATGTASVAGRWTAAGGWQELGPLPADGGLFDGETASVYALSGDGQSVAGLYWRPGASGGSAHAMTWTAATGMRDLGSSGRSSRINAASGDGQVLAGWDEHPDFGNRRAAVWVNGVRSVLFDSDWPSEALAINPAGTVIVGYAGNPVDFQTWAARWTWNGSGWDQQLLGVLPKRNASGFAYAAGVSADGSLVVGGYRPDVQSPKSKGFVWTAADGFVDASDWLRAQGVRLNPLAPVIGLSAVSADGRTIAVVTQQAVAPFATRTLLVRRAP